MEQLGHDVDMLRVLRTDYPRLEQWCTVCERLGLLTGHKSFHLRDVHCIREHFDHTIQKSRLSHLTEEVVVADRCPVGAAAIEFLKVGSQDNRIL